MNPVAVDGATAPKQVAVSHCIGDPLWIGEGRGMPYFPPDKYPLEFSCRCFFCGASPGSPQEETLVTGTPVSRRQGPGSIQPPVSRKGSLASLPACWNLGASGRQRQTNCGGREGGSSLPPHNDSSRAAPALHQTRRESAWTQDAGRAEINALGEKPGNSPQAQCT